MNRLLLVVVFVSTSALAEDWNKKTSDYYSKQLQERKKLGLDKDTKKLKAEYPTPEMKFVGAGGGGAAAACVLLCPGKTATVKLEGKLPPKSLVVPESDDVEVVTEALTPKGWEATVKAKPLAAPRKVEIAAMAAVSAIRTSTSGLEIGCKYTIVLDVKDGDSVTLKPEFACGGGEVTVPGEWKRGEKVLGTMSYQVRRDYSGLMISLATQEEQMKQTQAMMAVMSSAEMKEINKRADAVMKKMNECGKVPPAQMGACFKGPQAELEAINKDREALAAAAEKKASMAFGCGRFDVRLKDGKIEGDAEMCSGRRLQERVPVTGRYTAP